MTPPVYAVADLHGRLDLLEAALALLPDAHLVMLGDVIDRGPQGLAAVRRLLALQEEGRVTLLWGNHEQMAVLGHAAFERYREGGDLDVYREALSKFRWWSENGGDAVRREYGGFGVENYPPELLEYLSRLRYAVYVDANGERHDAPPAAPSVLACHAAPPKAHPQYGSPEVASLWMRPHEGPFPLPEGVTWSVHGHTPLAAPARVDRQVYTDLGAVLTGRLCLTHLHPDGPGEALVLQGPGSRRAPRLPILGLPLPVRTVVAQG